ncbi:uncharacterized protein LOC117222924 isoform X3 [Megalopta genalis]|uniref:uncharacterized protein LOC117222924 isoform X3 n=1 Tax=Megalopta genalis TaxID=115081 RepID=UPI003FD2CCDA
MAPVNAQCNLVHGESVWLKSETPTTHRRRPPTAVRYRDHSGAEILIVSRAARRVRTLRMKLWAILLVCGAAGTFATQVPIDSGPNDWSWQPSASLEAVESAAESQDGSSNTDAKLTSEPAPSKEFFGDAAREQRSVEAVVDEILASSRQGRSIEGFDQVYADPNVKNALQLGNDTVARSYIRDKLCTLGLMNCENVEGRRPYYSPHRGIYPQDIIYAQPVTIKPVGRPLPAIPVKRPYGPPKVPPGLSGSSSFGSSGLTSDIVYGLGGGPVPPPSISQFPGGPGGLISSYPGGLKRPGPPFPSFASSKPVYEGGFDYEGNDRFIDKKQIALRPGVVGADGSVQQHVHHHYHHGEGASQAGGFVGSPSIGLGTVGASYDHPGQSIYAGGFQDSDDYKKAFKVKAPSGSGGNGLIGPDGSASANNYANRYPVYEKPPQDFTYAKQDGQKTGKYYGPGNYVSSNAVQAGSNDYSFGSSNANNNYYNQNENEDFGNDFTGSYGADCVCVPYEQCQASEHAGRKDDLYLAIDPRNLNKNIEAEAADAPTDASSLEGNGTTSVVDAPTSSGTEARAKREVAEDEDAAVEGRKKSTGEGRQFLGGPPRSCSPGFVCCRRRQQASKPRPGQCGTRYTQGINGRIKTPVNVDGDAEFGEYPWQVAILKKDPTESVYVCGGTLISSRHILTAAHCVKTYAAHDLRVRLGEWDVNHDVEFYPYIERDVANIVVHPEFYAGTLYNDIAILRIDHEVDFLKNPHISPACLPDKRDDFVKSRCWTTGWGKDAFGDFGKYQNILKEVDVPVVNNQICEHQMRRTRLGPGFNLHPGFICAGGEEGKDACKGDGGGPMVCERQGRWQLAGIVSWGIGCGQAGVPGVYSRVSHYLDWIRQITNRY